jgi:hypothetical protein
LQRQVKVIASSHAGNMQAGGRLENDVNCFFLVIALRKSAAAAQIETQC